jgi:hypothetical protein
MYSLADEEVTKMAEGLIEKWHRHLNGANITYLFRDRPWKTSESRIVLGRASKRNEIDKLLSPKREDFIIIISKPSWDTMTLDHKQQLLDHELCHAGVQVTNSGDRKWILRQHPIEDFPENLARFEFRRQELGTLIENPPSAIVTKTTSVTRRLRIQTNRTGGNE